MKIKIIAVVKNKTNRLVASKKSIVNFLNSEGSEGGVVYFQIDNKKSVCHDNVDSFLMKYCSFFREDIILIINKKVYENKIVKRRKNKWK